MLPWNDWWHVNGNTYGTWLRGDPRGWRARHHREHVEGDYKNPPPDGAYDKLLAQSKRRMNRPPVRLSAEAQQLACRTMVASLQRHEVEVVALSVDDHHFHLLARFPEPKSNPTEPDSGTALRNQVPWASRKDGNVPLAVARHFVGIAKKDSAYTLSKSGLVCSGGAWATRCRCLPIRDRSHQLNVARYIVEHVRRNAAVWTVWQDRRTQE